MTHWMAPWKTLLQKSLQQNSSLPYSKYMQLATVRPDGKPANRTVVFRGFLQTSDDLTFVTDIRTRKVVELSTNAYVEICWYFPSSREQYRLAGTVEIVTESHTDEQLLEARQQAWTKMSDAGRSQFGWPQPGQPRMPMDEHLFLQPAPQTAGPVLPEFCLGVVRVQEVDHVDLFTNKRTQFSTKAAAAAAVQAEGENNGSDCSTGEEVRQASAWQTLELNP